MKRLLVIAWLASIAPCFAQLDYVLKPTENIQIHAPESPKIDGRIFQIQADGFVVLPSIGRVHVGGMKLREFQKTLARSLQKANGVTVSVVAFRSPSR